MVIGRSGTGKTTCAVLRMFSMEMLFKLRMSINSNKQKQLADGRMMPDDIDSAVGLHCVFITVSPVLTNEVRRFYDKLTK